MSEMGGNWDACLFLLFCLISISLKEYADEYVSLSFAVIVLAFAE